MRSQLNEFLTRTGPGTPMGELFRRYWQPVLMSSDLPAPDCPQVRVKLLSERLLAFRDSEGRLGLVDEFCAHRGASLWFGRNEESGIRCAYHGWKYDVTGQCVELPSEPVETGICKAIRLKSYPLVERGGILWAYMGPPELRPPLPEFEFAMVGDKHRFLSKRVQETNYLQAVEGATDPDHLAFLHRGTLNADRLMSGSRDFNPHDSQIKYEVVETDGGLLFATRRNAENGNYAWRCQHWAFPTFNIVAPRADNPVLGHLFVPIDDENCWNWNYNYHPTRELSDEEVKAMKEGHGIHARLIPGTFTPVQNKNNDYLMDRAAQKAGITFSGIEGFGMQDSSIQESQGTIADRGKEFLVATDTSIIMIRRRLQKAAEALQKGVPPPGLDPVTHRVRSAAMLLPRDVPFMDAFKDALKVRDGVPYATL